MEEHELARDWRIQRLGLDKRSAGGVGRRPTRHHSMLHRQRFGEYDLLLQNGKKIDRCGVGRLFVVFSPPAVQTVRVWWLQSCSHPCVVVDVFGKSFVEHILIFNPQASR